MLPHDLLHHYCDLNEIPFHASRDAVVDYLVAHPTHTVAYLTPYGRVFDLVHQFAKGEIDLEMMMTSGDMNHAHNSTLPIIEHADCIVFDLLMADKIGGPYNTMIEIH